MSIIRFSLSLPAHTYRRYYAGQARFIQVRSVDGRNLRFPAEFLRPYLSHSGVYGEFELEYDEHNKLVALRRRD